MENYNLGRMLPKYIHKLQSGGAVNKNAPSSGAPGQAGNANFQSNMEPMYSTSLNSMQMNTLKSMDQSLYVKDLLKLPRNMNELLYILQKNMTQAQFNQRFLNHVNAQRNILSQMQAQILAQLQGLSTTQMQATLQQQMSQNMQAMLKNLPISTTAMINLNEIDERYCKTYQRKYCCRRSK